MEVERVRPAQDANEVAAGTLWTLSGRPKGCLSGRAKRYPAVKKAA
jgi:hypothetical protein